MYLINAEKMNFQEYKNFLKKQIEETKDINEIISILRVKIKEVAYKDLIPSEKRTYYRFSDNVEEEPLKEHR